MVVVVVVGGYREGSKEEVKEVAGVRKEKGRLAVPLCQERCHVRGALLHLCHITVVQCVRVYMSQCFLYDSTCLRIHMHAFTEMLD